MTGFHLHTFCEPSVLSPRGPGTLCPALSALPSWHSPCAQPSLFSPCGLGTLCPALTALKVTHLCFTSRGPGMELTSKRAGTPHLLCSRSVLSQVPCTEQVFSKYLSYLSDLNLCLTNVCYRDQFLERGCEGSDVGPASRSGCPRVLLQDAACLIALTFFSLLC